MKRKLGILTVIAGFIFTSFFATSSVKASNIQPQYDATFNNNKGILYANGNDIIINKNSNGKTIVNWDGGNVEVPETVCIVGGGKEETVYEKSNIIMEDGTVSLIYGGGMSLIENKISTVNTSNVTINGGTVLETVYGGGLIYSKVETGNLTINGGIIKSVVGGGAASASISGISYSAGTETDMQNSKNRVDNANATINGGTIDSTPSNYGLVFGGGQGYSYVGNSNLIINNGNMSKAYVTAGGSNGYTKNTNTEISGGTINFFQTVNRGKEEFAKVKISGGEITTAYIGGETATDVTGIISKVDFSIIGGNVNQLNAGTSGGNPLNIDQENYKIVYVTGTVTDSQLAGKEKQITYEFNINEDSVTIYKNWTKNLNTNFKTNPVGYEYLFNDKDIIWNSEDENIATINQAKELKGINIGKTTITANHLDKTDTIEVEVILNPIITVSIILFVVFAIAISIFLLFTMFL